MRAAQRRRYYEQSQTNDRRREIRWTESEDARIIAKDRPTDRKLEESSQPLNAGNPATAGLAL
jgi:hypothetical protein